MTSFALLPILRMLNRHFPGALPAVLGVLILLAVVPARAEDQDGKLVNSSAILLKDSDLKPLQALVPDIRAVLEQTDIKAITYLSDGLKIKGYLAAPKQGDHLPCVIWNRGGNRDSGALDDTKACSILGRLASWGYLVVASQYRGNAGGEGKEEFGGKDVDDVMNLIPLLQSLPQADPKRIGMCGYSRGGMMTYLALARTDRIAAAVVGFGISDAFETVASRPDMETNVFAELVPDFRQDRAAALEARSAVRWVEKLNKNTPILLLHGTADWRVSPMQALQMATALYQHNHPFRFVLLEGAAHGLREFRPEVNRLTKDWLDRYVRDRQPWPSLEPHGE
jgi:dipeptidyl aminopeptidase/acylaminoacyl peptidase